MSNFFDEPAGRTAFLGLTVISSYVSATRQSTLAVIVCSASLALVNVTVRISLKPNGITPNSIEETSALMVGGMARPCEKKRNWTVPQNLIKVVAETHKRNVGLYVTALSVKVP